MLNNVRLVEIEIHSFCNRQCLWCPNKFIDRMIYKEMDSNLYTKILKELKDNGFRGVISYSRYNEPMSNIELFKQRLWEAKQILPYVKTVSNTNGDFLTAENLDDLLIDELTVMDYDCIGVNILKEKILSQNITIEKIDEPFIYCKYKNIKILYYMNWPMYANIEDRGGSLREYSLQKRITPCFEPVYFIGIDYTGKVTPCCHIRGDNPQHKNYILGDLNKSSLVDIYYSKKAIRFREERKNCILSGPCEHCEKQPGRYTRDNPNMKYSL